MTGRVNRYFQHPASPAFIRHMIHETGLCELDQKIVRNLREFSGDTELHAQAVGLTDKDYNRRTANLSIRLMDELFRLAQIGYEYESRRDDDLK